MTHKILVIDDDTTFLKSMKKILSLKHFEVDTLANPSDIYSYLEKSKYDTALVDIKMPGISGLEVLRSIRHNNPSTPVIMISGYSDIQAAVTAIKDGAYDFLEKPVDADRLFITIRNALQKQDLLDEAENLGKEIDKEYRILIKSQKMQSIYDHIRKVAPTPATILILGETGVGKELVAWSIYRLSLRKTKPYVRFNCAAVPKDLLESELFGHRKGSFTGAISDKKGRVVEADGGTLFLDEIGDLDINLQAKLLRLLDHGEVQVIGENLPRAVDIRIITASNKNLEKMVQEGKFREDLYHRINVIKIVVPPLRERPDDVMPIARHYIQYYCENYNKPTLTLARNVEETLKRLSWPGNVRELKNLMEKLVICCEGDRIEIEDIQTESKDLHDLSGSFRPHDHLKLRTAQEIFERKYIIQALETFDWRMIATAKALGIDRTNLYKKMKKLGIKKNGKNSR